MPAARIEGDQPIKVTFKLPDGFKINAAAPSELSLKSGAALIQKWSASDLIAGFVKLARPAEAAELELEGTFYLCQKGDANICTQARLKQAISWARQAGQAGPPGSRDLEWAIPAPEL